VFSFIIYCIHLYTVFSLQVKSAEAEAEAKYLSGVGVAKQRKAIVDGLRSSIVVSIVVCEGSITIWIPSSLMQVYLSLFTSFNITGL